MISIFGSKKNKELENILDSLHANMSNNYKDNAQNNLKELIQKYDELIAARKLNDKQQKHYSEIIEDLKEQMKGYSHKDQKPYWT